MDATVAVNEVYLLPGDFCFGEGNLRISTILGSCISITLWHPLLAHGGMCHYMLPHRKRPLGTEVLDGKYGDEAMKLFMLELSKRNTHPAQYQVHVYGGGNMFNNSLSDGMNIGRKNIEMALTLLNEHGFPTADGSFGSFGHRKVVFDVWSGEVHLIHVDNREAGS